MLINLMGDYSKNKLRKMPTLLDLDDEKPHKENLLVLPRDVIQCFININTMDFDVFELSKITNGNELVTMM